MKSKIIHLADRTKKDKDELRLEALFKSEAIPDSGFGEKIVARVRRRSWFRRWLIPAALVVGTLIAVKPASVLVVMAVDALAMLPPDQPVSSPLAAVVAIGGTIVLVALMLLRALEE